LKLPASLPDAQALLLSDGLEAISLSYAATREGRKNTGPWQLWWLIEGENDPDLKALQDQLALWAAVQNMGALDLYSAHWAVEPVDANIDWLARSYEGFPPFSIGPFFIYGSHYEGAVPEGQTGLLIDAATAFGSGEHGTTKGCIQAMLDLKGKGVCPWNVLDMGTGSGILAIAAWKLWKTPVLAVDIDEESVRVTRHHMSVNGVVEGAASMRAFAGDGFATPQVAKSAPYELIIANILAGPVIEMAPDLCKVLDINGYTVLSGMLGEQADLVASAYEGCGLTLKNRYDVGEWTSLVMHKT
jgi:ribosomal protein L11 methyltransferase